MAGIEHIFQTIANSNPISRNIYLDILSKNHTIYDDKNVTSQKITSLLSKSTSRSIGLRFLIVYLDQDQCSINALEKKAHLWLTSIMKSCNSLEIRSYGHLIYEALALLIQRIQSTFEVSKTFASTYLIKFFESLSLKEISENIPCTIGALHALKQCLRYYPGPSKAGRTMATKYLVSLVDSSDVDVVHRSGECWLMLQQVRGGSGNIGDNKDKGQWRDFQTGILGNLHELLNVTISSQEEIYERPVISRKLEYFELELKADPIERSAGVCRRFCNLVDFLKIALSEPFPVKKCIYPKKILGLIQRGLGIKLSNFKNNPNIDNLCFGTLLPELHIKLLELLEVLIIICHTHLRMHFRLILSILLDSLKSTKLVTNKGPRDNFVNLRSVVYRVITRWSSVLKDGSHCEIISDYLIKEILDDVQPSRSNKCSELQRSNNLPRRKNDTEYSFDDFSGKGNNSSLCQEAFCCLRDVLQLSGHLIKHSIVKEVYNTLLIICIEMQRNHNSSLQSCNWKYRLEIYKTLLTLIQSRNYRSPPPTEIILYLLDETRSRDNSSEVRLCCQNIIDAVENMLHPQKESIFFKRDLKNDKSTTEEEPRLSLNGNSSIELENDSEKDDNNYAPTRELEQINRSQLKAVEFMEVEEPTQNGIEIANISPSQLNDDQLVNEKSSNVVENTVLSSSSLEIGPPNGESRNKPDIIPEAAPLKVEESSESKAISEIKNYRLSSNESSQRQEQLQSNMDSQMADDTDDAFVDELSAAFVNEFK